MSRISKKLKAGFKRLVGQDRHGKAAHRSPKVTVPAYDPTTIVPLHLTADELEAILGQTVIAKKKKLCVRLEASVGTKKAVDLSVEDWSTVCLALCGTKVKEVRVRKHLFIVARKIVDGLSEALEIDGQPHGRSE